MNRYRVIGANGSPYSMKLRALMRYRRLPFDWVYRSAEEHARYGDKIKVALVPVLHIPADEGDSAQDQWMIDSTPIALALEQRHSERSVLPDHPGLAFLARLIEDMADEWLTKAMFLYRWELPEDQAYSSGWIMADSRPELHGEALAAATAAISERQVGRMALVGCTEHNAPVIKESYWRLLNLLNGHVGLHQFLFGTRPSLADFGCFGQLKTLATDTTPMLEMRSKVPRVEHWVRQMDDLSGNNGQWIGSPAELPEATTGLLELVGSVYLPFLEANAAALVAGNAHFEVELLGQTYRQAPFAYQGACLRTLRKALQDLQPDARTSIQDVLTSTGCWDALTASA